MPWRSIGAASMRQPSMVTSWLAAAKAVRNAKRTLQPRLFAGAPKASPESPAATPSWAISIQPRRRPSQAPTSGIFVDDRRPGELEGERERRIAHEPDRRVADPRLAQPGRLGREDQKERQPRGEAEREHQREARISQNFAERERFAGRCHGPRMAQKPLTGDSGSPAIRKRPLPPFPPSR